MFWSLRVPISPDSVIYILVVLGLRKLAEMELYIETLTGTFFELRVSPFETIMSVKAKIQRLEGKAVPLGLCQ